MMTQGTDLFRSKGILAIQGSSEKCVHSMTVLCYWPFNTDIEVVLHSLTLFNYQAQSRMSAVTYPSG